MILGTDRLLQLVADPEVRIITGLGERELSNPEGTGFDLRIGKLYRLKPGSTGFLYNDGLTLRKTPNIEVVCEFDPRKDLKQQEIASIVSEDYFLLETLEYFRVPIYAVGVITPRTTLFRSGILFASSLVAPGYGLKSDDPRGASLTFGISNPSRCPFVIQMGARIANIVFALIEGKAEQYRGQWQADGGRVRTDAEAQI